MKSFRTGLAGLGMLVAPHFAQATLMTSTSSEMFFAEEGNVSDRESGTNNNPVAVHNSNNRVELAGFDSSLGSLQSVELSFDSDWYYIPTITAGESSGPFKTTSGSGNFYFNVTASLWYSPPKVTAQYNDTSLSRSDINGFSSGPFCKESERVHGSFSGGISTGSLDLSNFIDGAVVIRFAQQLMVEALTSDPDTSVTASIQGYSRCWRYVGCSYTPGTQWRGSANRHLHLLRASTTPCRCPRARHARLPQPWVSWAVSHYAVAQPGQET